MILGLELFDKPISSIVTLVCLSEVPWELIALLLDFELYHTVSGQLGSNSIPISN